jgi:rhodanese-related sulfurtransferase
MEEYLDFASRNWTLFALLGVVLAAFVTTEVLRARRGGQTVNAAEALRLFNDENAILVDVREIAEYRDGHIPEATNVPLGTLKKNPGELTKHKSRPVIVYCKTGNRSPSVVGDLKKQGFERIYHLSGGLESWKSASLPVVKGRK